MRLCVILNKYCRLKSVIQNKLVEIVCWCFTIRENILQIYDENIIYRPE